MSNPLPQYKLKEFIDQVKNLQSINFPSIAEKMSLDWFTDIKPRLDTDPWFKEALAVALERIKFELYDGLLTVGKEGKRAGRGSPEITYVNAIIKHIDSGALLGAVVDEKAPGGGDTTMTPEAEAEHLRRLGIGVEDVPG